MVGTEKEGVKDYERELMDTWKLTENVLKINLAREFDMSCQKCGKDFEIGDDIVSIRRARKTKRYHKKCWDSYYIDV